MSLFIQGSLRATDPDNGANGVVSYSLTSQDGTSNPAHFSVNNNAEIRTAVSLDREATGIYNLWLVASDGNATPRSTSLLIRILVTDKNDNSPVLTVSSTNQVHNVLNQQE